MTIASYIRDAAYGRLLNVAAWKSTRKVPIPPLQGIDQCPALGAFILRENMTPNGDANVGPPRYIADAVIAFSVMDALSKPEVLGGSVDTMIDLIQDRLLKDGTFIDLRTPTGDRVIDSIPNIARTYNFPNSGETYFLECRLQLTFRYFCFFDPLAPNLLRDVAVDVRPNNNPVPVGDPYHIPLTG
jgi:hypothetical protein